jgi:DNA-binding FadR family transcriptional regulator
MSAIWIGGLSSSTIEKIDNKENYMSSKVTVVTDVLMARIISGEYVDFLPPQDKLSRSLRVSRTSVREAISKLEVWNVLAVRPKTGTKINAPTAWSLVNLPVVKYRLMSEGRELSVDTIDSLLAEIRASLLEVATHPGD